jgi:hypothetical protein
MHHDTRHNYVLVIPGTRPSKFEKTCKSNGYFIVNKPSVIKIPYHCKIENEKIDPISPPPVSAPVGGYYGKIVN